MATTAFWPVKGSLKAVIDYADNPDKTTNPKYLDDDLAQVLRYAERDDKTDQRLFVSGVNCTPERAYEEMKAVQIRFGMRGTNVTYHGYQSFPPGEVTPEQAHRIGIETAKRMWGDQYQVVVTTHLNTTSIHNHLVLNAVSFKDGKKFQNHIRDHIRLREVSDLLCRERGLSVLEDAPFYKTESRGEYWARRRGSMTHRDILKQDIEDSLQYAMDFDGLISQLRAKGYLYDWERGSIRAPDWERAIRLDRLGFSFDFIQERTRRNLDAPDGRDRWNSHLPYRPKRFPLLELEQRMEYETRHSDDTVTVMIDVVFLIIMAMLDLTRAEREGKQSFRPLSPSIRAELARFDRLHEEYMVLSGNRIHTENDLAQFISEKESQIGALERERQGYRNQLRRPKPPEIETELKEKITATTNQLKPLHRDLAAARRVSEHWRHLYELLQSEREMEIKALKRERNRGR